MNQQETGQQAACGNCRYWVGDEDTQRGECRIQPPQVSVTYGVSLTEWPVVDSGKWCGHHALREPLMRHEPDLRSLSWAKANLEALAAPLRAAYPELETLPLTQWAPRVLGNITRAKAKLEISDGKLDAVRARLAVHDKPACCECGRPDYDELHDDLAAIVHEKK